MRCTHCGFNNPENARFCSRCGATDRILHNAYTAPTRTDPPQYVTTRLLVLFGLLLLAIVIATSVWTSSPGLSQPTSVARAQSQNVLLKQRLAQATSLLTAARKESHPGLIYRFACQIPADSPEYVQSERQLSRADHILTQVVLPGLRSEAAQRLQDGYYEQGKKVDVRVIEGDEPTLQLQYILFDETSAYVAKSEANRLAQSLLPLGFYHISFVDGFGHGSSVGWKANDVEHAKFADIHKLCEQVRSGEASPEELNATVRNPPI